MQLLLFKLFCLRKKHNKVEGLKSTAVISFTAFQKIFAENKKTNESRIRVAAVIVFQTEN